MHKLALIAALFPLAACVSKTVYKNPNAPPDDTVAYTSDGGVVPLRAKLKAVKAPELTLGNGAWLNTDRPLRFSDELKGRVVLVDFWTSACINCLHNVPMLNALEERFRDAPFTIVGVHAGKFPAEHDATLIRTAMRRHGIDHPVVVDNDYLVWAMYSVQGWPTLALIDPEGYVVAMEPGEPDGAVLETAIGNLLADGAKRGVLASGPLPWKPDATVAAPAGLAFPGKVAALDSDRVAIADTGNNRVIVATNGGKVLHVVGSGRLGLTDGDFAAAAFAHPQGLAGRGDVLYVADTDNHAVRKIDLATKSVSTIAGTGAIGRGVRPMEGPGPTIALRSPWDLALVGDVLFVALAGQHQLYRLEPRSLALTRFSGSGKEELTDGKPKDAAFAQPSGLASDGKFLYVADSEVSAVRRVALDSGDVGTIVGKGLFEFGDVDGQGAAVRLQHPLGVAVLGDELVVADTFNGKLKRLTKAGAATTLAAGLAAPGGVAVVGGKLLVADTDAHRLAWVDPKSGAVEAFPLGELPPVSRGPARQRVPLAAVKVKPGAATLVVQVSAPNGETFKADAPQAASVATSSLSPVEGRSGIALSGPRTLTVSAERLEIAVPVTVAGAGAVTAEVDAFSCSAKKQACRLSRRAFELRLEPAADAPDRVEVRAPIN